MCSSDLNVSIISVNGLYEGDNASSELNVSGQVRVPRSVVAANPSADPVASSYMPSSLTPAQSTGLATSIIDMSFTTTKTAYVFVPGYVAVPQGQINIAVGAGMGANKDVELVGAVLAAKVLQTTDKPATLSLGMVNRIVQKTFKLVSTTTTGTPAVTSVALVQVNDYGEFAVNSWVTSSAGSGT